MKMLCWEPGVKFMTMLIIHAGSNIWNGIKTQFKKKLHVMSRIKYDVDICFEERFGKI